MNASQMPLISPQLLKLAPTCSTSSPASAASQSCPRPICHHVSGRCWLTTKLPMKTASALLRAPPVWQRNQPQVSGEPKRMTAPARVQPPPCGISQFQHGEIAEELRRDRRLRILQILNEVPAGVANDAVLKNLLRTFGHAVSGDLVRTELSWLEEQGLLSIARESGLQVATLSERGGDVASGLANQSGVSRP